MEQTKILYKCGTCLDLFKIDVALIVISKLNTSMKIFITFYCI